MLINVHCHIAAGQDVHGWFERQNLDQADVTLVCGDWDKCQEAIETFPKRVIALGMLSYGQEQPELVDRFHERGFRGLKMIELHRAYDDPAYYPIYEKAVEYEMPILFHTGHLRWCEAHRRNVISRRKMDASRLDGVARAFPELYLIGAHLGNPCYEDACSLALKHKRLYFDLTGGTARNLPYSRWRQLLMTGADGNLRSLEEKLHLGVVNKFVFGTDGQPVPNLVEFYENLFSAFDFPPETRELIRWRNAARMFGIEEELEAQAAVSRDPGERPDIT
jgi:hypothetical protein